MVDASLTACPDCGCEDTYAEKSDVRFAGLRMEMYVETRRCRHCHTRFTVTSRVEEVAASTEWQRTLCPRCGAPARVYCTRDPVRYCACNKCGFRFKAV